MYVLLYYIFVNSNFYLLPLPLLSCPAGRMQAKCRTPRGRTLAPVLSALTPARHGVTLGVHAPTQSHQQCPSHMQVRSVQAVCKSCSKLMLSNVPAEPGDVRRATTR